jgi:DNA-binding ferritin-like protein (Dps family)
MAQIYFHDLSSSDDSDLEDLLGDDIEQFVLLLAVKELQDCKQRKRPASKCVM